MKLPLLRRPRRALHSLLAVCLLLSGLIFKERIQAELRVYMAKLRWEGGVGVAVQQAHAGLSVSEVSDPEAGS